MMPAKLSIGEIQRQVRAVEVRAPHHLPAAWYDQAGIKGMSEWLTRFVPMSERQAFRYCNERWLS